MKNLLNERYLKCAARKIKILENGRLFPAKTRAGENWNGISISPLRMILKTKLMKTQQYFRTIIVVGILWLGATAANAQTTKAQTKIKTDDTKIKSEEKVTADDSKRVESLSGINLFPDRKTGNFRLRFTQNLKDSANLELKNDAGQILFAKALSAAESYTGKPMEIGPLKSGI